MKEIEKIKKLLDIEVAYRGIVNKSDFIVCIGSAAFSTIKMNLSVPEYREQANILGIEYRVIDCRDPYYITVIHKDLIHSLLREVQHANHKAIDAIAYRTNK